MKQENDLLATQSTEERIKEAAARVFVKKGFAATKTRDIAEEAGINIASLHYYYRSKDKLFELVIGEALRKFSGAMDEILGSIEPVHLKIRKFVHRYIDFFKENPYVPLFIMSESQSNPDKVDKMLDTQQHINILKKQLEELADKGVIRSVHHAHFFMNLISLTAFPFISKALMMRKVNLSSEAYDKLLEERKEMIPEMIMSYFYLKKPD